MHTIFNASATGSFQLRRFRREIQPQQTREKADNEDQPDEAEDVGDGVSRGDVRHHLVGREAFRHGNVARPDGLLGRRESR